MLHGFPQTSQSYRHQIPVLAAAGFRVVTPDQRGYSPGAWPGGVEAYTIDHLVDDVVGMVDALGRERFHVVGHDWGAAVAWLVTGQFPERVISLIAVSVPHPFAFAEALQDPSGEQAAMSGYMARFREVGSELTFLADDAALLRGIYSGAGLSSSEIQAYVDVLGTPEALGAALNWHRAMLLPPGTRTFTPIATPTMLRVEHRGCGAGSHGSRGDREVRARSVSVRGVGGNQPLDSRAGGRAPQRASPGSRGRLEGIAHPNASGREHQLPASACTILGPWSLPFSMKILLALWPAARTPAM